MLQTDLTTVPYKGTGPAMTDLIGGQVDFLCDQTTLVAALQAALKDPNVVSKFAELGTEPVALSRATPEALKSHLTTEIDKWSPIIKKAGIYAD